MNVAESKKEVMESSAGSSDGSTGKSFDRTEKENQDMNRMKVAESEQRRVTALKTIMILVLVAVAAGLSTATYLFVKKEEQEDFEKEFETMASQIIAVSRENVQSALIALSAFSTSITSYAKDTGQVWPFVTVRNYAAMSVPMAKLVGDGKLVLAPFVSFEQRIAFEEYASEHVYDHIQDVLDYNNLTVRATDMEDVVEHIVYTDFATKKKVLEPYEGEDVQSEYLVNWQNSNYTLVPGDYFVMTNAWRVASWNRSVTHVKATKRPKIDFFQGVARFTSQMVQPVFNDVFPPHEYDKGEIVGIVLTIIEWEKYFNNILPKGAIDVVMESSCGFNARFEVRGEHAALVGFNDFYEGQFGDLEIITDFVSLGTSQEDYPEGICVDELTLRLFPADELRASSESSKPIIYTVSVASIFLFTSLVFLVYDWTVRRRQQKVMTRVITQDKIVSSLFPATVRDRLYMNGDRQNGGSDGQSQASSQRESLWMNEAEHTSNYGDRPIADLFLETTILFADIAGFTAWGSAREPSQVFILLETIYGAFDKLSHKYGVFKIETIGDCYVAATGLPNPNKDHAVIMAKFARECMEKMDILTTRMEIGLGPDTGDLDLRIGIHSGQVTAGVLRGEKSRFQLFGDTVNVAARMESTGMRRKIQISNTTATILKTQGRSKWIVPRGDVMINGKGTMKTFWLETKSESEERRHISCRSHSTSTKAHSEVGSTVGESHGSTEPVEPLSEEEADMQKGRAMSKTERLVEWNVEMLSALLRQLVAARDKKSRVLLKAEKDLTRGRTVLGEFVDVITIPKITMDDLKNRKDAAKIVLEDKVICQLRALLSQYADVYRPNAFHSFEHASHVTASVAKLMSRIVTADTTNQTSGPEDWEKSDIAGHSYGITSDPLTQFAVVFSAIIHDIDHPGVPNAQLIKEEDPLVVRYEGKSLAEQNSVDLAWDILLQPEYTDLRACIYADEGELRRFRQLLVNMVMATDIADKELGALRKERWSKAFAPEENALIDPNLRNRKATIVLEHLIQASDVSHTMQHWQVFKKWNQKFFEECYNAWKAGRAGEDPCLVWYESEIAFFDFYVIPLAKKLHRCGVFGVSGQEYLNYAVSNREEWKRTGKEIVKDFLRAVETAQE